MTDYGAEYTDKELEKMEKKIKQIYSEAEKDIQKKMNEFNQAFKAKEAVHLQELKDGKITQADFDAWKRGQVFQGQQWQSKKDQISGILYNANKEAAKILNGGTMDVFAENANWSHYEMEHTQGVNFGFGLYDAHTVTNLVKNDPQVLPKWKVNEKKDYKWNGKKVDNAITQGIIQGEKLDQITDRLVNSLSAQNRNTMLTFARTAMTGAQNAGRNQGLMDAKELDIDVVKVWMATLDDHTRASHQEIDGEEQKVGDKWHPFKFSNGCRYPGDPMGPPHEVYNCRCTLVSDIKDFPSKFKRYDNIDGKPIADMSYREWKQTKTPKQTSENIRYGVFRGISFQESNLKSHIGDGTELDPIRMIMEDTGYNEKQARQVIHDMWDWTAGDFRGIRQGKEGITDRIDDFIQKSPKYNGEVYRGIVVDENTADNILNNLKIGKSINQSGISSWSTEKDYATEFVDMYKSERMADGVGIVFDLKDNKSGVSIKHIAEIDNDEVIAPSKAEYILDGEIKLIHDPYDGDYYLIPVKEKRRK